MNKSLANCSSKLIHLFLFKELDIYLVSLTIIRFVGKTRLILIPLIEEICDPL